VNMPIDVARGILEASKQRARELRSPVSIAKATTAVMFNQSTDAVAQWGSGIPGFASSLATMTQGKFIMAAGGWPIRLGGATIGGIGVSGGNAPGRDDEIAHAGLVAAEAMASAITASQPSMPAVQPPLPGVSQPYMQQPSSAPHPPIQPTPAYPSVPQPPASSQDFPAGTQYLPPGQDYPSNEETNSFDQFSENRSGGQP
jgi:hypothetical protein